MEQLEREASKISPISDSPDPPPDAQVNKDSESVKQELVIAEQPVNSSKDELADQSKDVSESEKLAQEKRESEKKPGSIELGDSVVNEKDKYGGSLSLARIQSLVSMTTPRSSNLSNVLGSPSFIEIDHSIDGFGCLFLPSVFPQPINVPQQLHGQGKAAPLLYRCTCMHINHDRLPTYIHV